MRFRPALLAFCAFVMGSKIGLLYAATLFYAALAVLAAWLPGIGPLLFGATASVHLLSTWLYLRSRRE